jgi:hypothetical protein
MTPQTLDVLRCHISGELTVIMSGMAEPPSVANLDTGTSIVLRPAKVDTTMARFGISTMHDASPHGANAWWGELPGSKDAAEARLALTLDGRIQFATVTWPARPTPEPAAKPPRPLNQSGRRAEREGERRLTEQRKQAAKSKRQPRKQTGAMQ